MGHGLQRAVNAARATRGLPPRVVHLIRLDEVTEQYVTSCGRLMSKTMHGSYARWDVTCKQCIDAGSERLHLSDEG